MRKCNNYPPTVPELDREQWRHRITGALGHIDTRGPFIRREFHVKPVRWGRLYIRQVS